MLADAMRHLGLSEGGGKEAVAGDGEGRGTAVGGTVYIMRGLPGSGKSSLTRSIAAASPSACVCSADDFFSRGGGKSEAALRRAGCNTPEKVYRFAFDRALLGKAHGQCRDTFDKALARRVACVIVDNTNSTRQEYEYYAKRAGACGYALRVIELRCASMAEVQACCARCVHKVPWHVYEMMLGRWEQDQRAVVVASPGHHLL